MITNIYFTNPVEHGIQINHDNQARTYDKHPTTTPEVVAWEETNTIPPYDPLLLLTDDELREQKYNLNASLANEEIELAEHTPQQGVNLDDRGAIKENLHRNNRAKRNTSMTDQDDAMADYVDSVYDALDIADDIVESLDRAALEAWDGSSINWPVWVAPV